MWRIDWSWGKMGSKETSEEVIEGGHSGPCGEMEESEPEQWGREKLD